MNQSIKLIAFDLDGTLVESAPDLADAVDATLEELGQPKAGEARVRGWIGNGVGMLMKRAMTGQMWPDADPPGFDPALERFMAHYAEGVCRRSYLYPGVREGLTQLAEKGYRLTCITNKHSRFTLPLLEQLGIAGFFGWVGCGDQFEKHKPHPESLLYAARHFGVDSNACLMVGDSLNDVEAARAAGFAVVCVPYGYRGDVAAENLGADAVIPSLAALPEWLQNR